ncbi:MAG TPA: sigma-70 family RNA polymerase sigma factor [bacterium]
MSLSLSVNITHASLPALPDSDLVELIATNSEYAAGAFEVLVDRYGALVRSVASKFLKNDQMALDDACQETFLKALSRIGDLRNRARFKSWICAIARNHALDSSKKRSLTISWDSVNEDGDTVTYEIADGRVNPSESVDVAEIADLMNDVLDEIPELYREPIQLRYSEDLDYSEIAVILGKPLGTVKSLIHRAKFIIRKELAKKTWGEEGLHVLAG